MKRKNVSWKLMVLAALLPVLVVISINVSLGDELHHESFKRFGNAILTSYVLVGIILVGNLFFYADSRHRPFAPLGGMVCAIATGLAVAWALISKENLLLEQNSGLRAQMLMNIVHTIVIGTAMALASVFAVGSTFTMITGRKRKRLFLHEEV